MTRIGQMIRTRRGELDEIVGPEENRIKLGLLPPSGPPRVMRTYEATETVLSRDQIRDLVSRSDRMSARQRWGREWIRDQDGRGACQGYASASCVERVRDLAGLDFVELSGDAAYALVNGGRDRGSGLANGLRAAANVGYPPASLVPRWEYRKNRIPQKAWDEASRFRGFEGLRVTTEQGWASAMALGFIGVVAVHVSGRYSQMDRHGISRGGNGTGNHAVCCDDIVWSAEVGDFLYDSPNSWKTSWGVDGRAYYRFSQHFKRTIQVHSFYVFRAARVDETAENPPKVKQ